MVSKTPQIKNYIVDLDETILHLRADWSLVRKCVESEMNSHGVPFEANASLDANLFRLRKMNALAFTQLLPLVAKLEQQRIEESPVNYSLVEELEAAGNWALFTANVSSTARAALALKDLKNLKPKLIVAKDDVEFPKPHPYGVLKILTSLTWKAAETLYIGDSQNDLKCATAAGLAFRKVTYF